MILEILNELERNNSRLHKESVLKNHKSLALLEKVLKYTLDTVRYQFYIKAIPEYKTGEIKYTLDQAIDLIVANLVTRKITGNQAIEFLRSVLSAVNEADSEVISRMIKRDLRCGVSDSTVNKIFKDLIFTYPCLLATSYSEKALNHITYPAYAQLKADGVRLNIVIDISKQDVRYYGRSGKEFNFNNVHDTELLAIANKYNKSIVLDGEALVRSGNDKFEFEPRCTGNGIISKGLHNTQLVEESEKITFVIWDLIEYSDFIEKKSTIMYVDRFATLQLVIKPSQSIQIIESFAVNSLKEAQLVYRNYISQGLEGIILKNYKGIWEDKRSKDLVKFKEELECELLVTGYKPGTGKFTGMIGSLDCCSKDGVLVNISGFTDDVRQLGFSHFDGKIITVKYNAIVTDSKTLTHSLFLPRFVEVRYDKSEPDTLLDK